LYAGANVDLGNSLVLGVDTDIVWSNKQDTKIVAKGQFEKPELPELPELGGTEEGGEELNERREKRRNLERSVPSLQRTQYENNHLSQREGYSSQTLSREAVSSRTSQQQRFERSARDTLEELQRQKRSQREVGDFPILRSDRESSPVRRQHVREVESVDEDELVGPIKKTDSNTLKQKWSGATRVRIGFAADRILPYIAGGVAYTQLQNTYSRSIEIFGREIRSSSVSDTKMMVGYTLGGGVDFAMADNVILRAEYRYSDFGKQKFAKDKLEIDYQTNDFRVGVAYKF
ncbi:outer membrane protein, partial [Bartonella bovis]|uniref:outer membrane protein n=1 Tax=Bartonella bovis TaxID=155194 RepID=UPI001FCE9962